MSQNWNLPIDATDVLSDSRTDINDGIDTLKTNLLGTANPAGALLVDGIIWVNTTDNKLRGRIAGANVDLGDWALEMGHVRKDGTVTMTGALSMGSNKVTNLSAPTASSDAARKSDVDARLAKAGDTLDSAALLSYSGSITLTDGLNLAHKTYVDSKIAKSGDTGITGRLAYSSALAASSSVRDHLDRDEIEKLVTFSSTVGHNHNGSNSRKVDVQDLTTADDGAKVCLVGITTARVTVGQVDTTRLRTDIVEASTLTTGSSGTLNVGISGVTDYCFHPLLQADGNVSSSSQLTLTHVRAKGTGIGTFKITEVELVWSSLDTNVLIYCRFRRVIPY